MKTFSVQLRPARSKTVLSCPKTWSSRSLSFKWKALYKVCDNVVWRTWDNNHHIHRNWKKHRHDKWRNQHRHGNLSITISIYNYNDNLSITISLEHLNNNLSIITSTYNYNDNLSIIKSTYNYNDNLYQSLYQDITITTYQSLYH